ncbi:FAD/NAD(P)-binding protein [Verrucomicrobiota bacterium]
MNSSSPYMPIPAKIENIVEETSNIKTFVVKPETPVPFKAGEFIELTVPGVGEAPFTPSSSPAVTDRMEVTIMRVGRITECLHALSPGADVWIRGPFGQPYPLDKFLGKEILIVGGGVGLAPLRALLFALFEDMDKYGKIIVRCGARTPGDIIYRKAVSEAWGKGDAVDVVLTVDHRDDTWTDNEGVVTTILEPDKLAPHPENGVAVVCGPPIMMKFATLKLLDLGYSPETIYLSMEKNMSCGVGKCGHCRIGPYYACKDGPVFPYDKIKDLPKIWD